MCPDGASARKLTKKCKKGTEDRLACSLQAGLQETPAAALTRCAMPGYVELGCFA